jgi:hypothetical protein
MPVRRLVAQDNTQDAQLLKVDHPSRYIENHVSEWQFLFGPNSDLNNSAQVLKVSARFNDDTFSNIQLVSYLYEPRNATIANSTNPIFKLYKVTTPDWTEQLITTVGATQLTNNYWYNNLSLSDIPQFTFDGGDTLMIEASVSRSGVLYRDRVYINHLGIYDSFIRLKQEVEFLDITKLDE